MRQVNPESSLDSATGRNDRLVEAIAKHPDRFAGFPALPAPDPEAADSELERCVADLGFKAVMIHGRSEGWFHDYARFTLKTGGSDNDQSDHRSRTCRHGVRT